MIGRGPTKRGEPAISGGLAVMPPIGRDEVAEFDGAKAEAERLFEIDLRAACADNLFHLAYQPQINVVAGTVTALEALLRWDHPTRGNIPPSDFIPIAEALGLIDDITRWALKCACRQAASWPDGVGVAVNVSASQLSEGTLPAMVEAALQESGLSPSRLELEITETVFLSGSETSMISLRDIQNSGVRIAIDDFDVGYSSLGYLIRFPFDKLKIDYSFTKRLGQLTDRSDVARAVVRTVVNLCNELKIDCSAEGVETVEQLNILREVGCTEVQGYLFGQPVLAQEVGSLLKSLTPALNPPQRMEFNLDRATVSFLQIVETANDIVIVTTPDFERTGPKIIYVNPAFTGLTGYTSAEVIGKTPRILQGPGTSRTTLDAIREALRAGRPVHEKVLNYAKCGAPYWLDLRIMALRASGGAITHYAAIQRDVTLDKRQMDELSHIANRDTLTGIPNRPALLKAIETEVNCAQSLGHLSRSRPCVAFIDVDEFKRMNDAFGHAVGDAILCGLADRLVENVRRLDIVGRLGGDEFLVCMPLANLRDGRALADRLRRAVAVDGLPTMAGPMKITVSIGVACWGPGDRLSDLLERADAALYAAKHSGRNRVRTKSAPQSRAARADMTL